MTVYVFIIESANSEDREQIFKDREIDNLTDPIYHEKLNLSGINEMVSDLEDKFNEPVLVTFVDCQYQNKYYYTPEGISEFEFLQELEKNTDLFKFCNCDWFQFVPEFEGISPNDHYIFASANNFENCYDMANFIQTPLYGNCYFIWNVKNIKSIVNAEAYYNIFSNIPRNKQMNSLKGPVIEDIDSINWIINEGVNQVNGLIEAGTLQFQRFIQRYVEEWTLNPYSIFSSGIITEFDLIPKPPPGETSKILKGFTVLEQFNEDAQYRYNITDYICRCLCKYGLEFDKIKSINNNPHTVNFNFLLAK